MTVKVIVSVDQVIQRMGLADVQGVSDTIESALNLAHVRFQGLLDTPFEVATRTEIFYLDSLTYPVVPNGFYRLRLTQAFLKSTPLIVSVGTSSTTASEVITVDSTQINRNKGIVHISEDYADKFVVITYSAGFDITNKAPDWLIEAVLAYMPFALNNQQSTHRADEGDKTVTKIVDQSGQMVAPYMRGVSFQFRPIF